jgi:Concanavalin A-like lectin/glucanases superfamily/Bacterial Ig domain/Purple acid Phosphatase, N-terminal domain
MPSCSRVIFIAAFWGTLLVSGTVHAAVLDASWTEPTTNVDGSPLTTLASYRLYVGIGGAPCPGPVFVQVAASATTPAPGSVVSHRLTGLVAGTTYAVSVTAVDTSGHESDCFAPAPTAAARVTFTVSPAGTVDFGNVALGNVVDRTFTVQNASGGTISGSASVPSPFSVVSGTPFTLAALGATQTVTVRFTPTLSAAATVNLTFTADGDSSSRTVTGVGLPAETTPPTVAITTPTSNPTHTASTTPFMLGGTAADNVGVAQVTWANNRGGSGTASGTTTWTAAGIALQPGANVLTVTARDTANNTGAASITVTLADTTAPSVALTAPAASATLSGTVTVTATATDAVGVTGVQFKLDGINLGAEDTISPYSVSWNTTTASNGSHTLTAVARDAAENSTTSAAVLVTVSNDTTPPVISGVSASGVSSTGATIAWTTNELSDSQVEYGPTTGYGSTIGLTSSLVTSHVQALSNLATNTLYHYRAKSRDAAGNLATSTDFTFTTTAPVTTGLVAHWALDDGSGTTATDSSGNGNTGSLVNGPVWSTGVLAQALTFNGAGSYVNVPHTAALNAYPLTIAAWIKTGATTAVSAIVNKFVAGTSNGYQLFVDNGRLCAWYLRDAANYVYDGTSCTLAAAGFVDNRWHHVSFVVDAAGGRLFIDGVQRTALGWAGTAGAPSTTQPVHLGDYAGAAGAVFSGLLDDVRIYNRALSPTEISNFYSGGAALIAPPVSSAISATGPTPSGVTIRWTTNVASASQVEYGLTTAYGASTALNTSLVTSHSVTLNGLMAGTVYHFRVRSQDAGGNLSVSLDSTFRTADPPAVAAPSSPKKKKNWFDKLFDGLLG